MKIFKTCITGRSFHPITKPLHILNDLFRSAPTPFFRHKTVTKFNMHKQLRFSREGYSMKNFRAGWENIPPAASQIPFYAVLVQKKFHPPNLLASWEIWTSGGGYPHP